MRELLKELRNMGKTIIISSHILSELSELCTSIGIIEAGKLIAKSSVEKIYQDLNIAQMIQTQIVNCDANLKQRISFLANVVSVEQDHDRVNIHTKDIEPEDLLEQLLALGAKVRMFQPGALDLETVFMKLTKGQTA